MILKDLFINIVTLVAQLLLVVLWLPYKLFVLLNGLIYGNEQETSTKRPKKAKNVKQEKPSSVFSEDELEFEFLNNKEKK
jgi:hypothetical protein